jgi:hypothetical protein
MKLRCFSRSSRTLSHFAKNKDESRRLGPPALPSSVLDIKHAQQQTMLISFHTMFCASPPALDVMR